MSPHTTLQRAHTTSTYVPAGKGTPYCLGFNPNTGAGGTQFTCFIGTKVQILTQKVESGDSRFLLFWLPHTKTVYEEKVKVTVGGYMFRQQVVK